MSGQPNHGIDHVVLCVRDLEAARAAFMHLGFTLTPHAVHPFGTGNTLVQLHGCFLELLTIADPAKIGVADGEFPFAAYNRAFLGDREGISMVALSSGDARADAGAFAAAGLKRYPTLEFARKARLPGGREAEVAFALAFAVDPRLDEAVFFTCQHRAPQNFWRPEYQLQKNGAHAVKEIVMLAAEPHALADFFARVQGEGAVTKDEGRLTVASPPGVISVLNLELAQDRFPGLPLAGAPDSPHFIGCRLAVHDLEVVRMRFDAGDIRYRISAGALQLAPADAFGVYLEFVEG